MIASSTPSSVPRRTRAEATAIPVPRSYSGPATEHTLNPETHESLIGCLTSPYIWWSRHPYFNLKKYNDHPSQLGDINEYEDFHDQLDEVWRHSLRVLVPGAVLSSTCWVTCALPGEQTAGMPPRIPAARGHQRGCRSVGFDYLTPILWNKIANAAFETNGNGGGFLGKPDEPNAIIKNDVEYILMLRKHGRYRSPTDEQRATSPDQGRTVRLVPPIWTDITGASTPDHPGAVPGRFHRLIRMFSFTGDTVLDPFAGTGTVALASMKADRNSICNELDPEYFKLAQRRIRGELEQSGMFRVDPELAIRRSDSRKTG